MKGFLVVYVNHQPDRQQEMKEIIDIVLNINKDVFAKARQELGLETLVVPTIHESCRVEVVRYQNDKEPE